MKLHNGPDATWPKDVYDKLQALSRFGKRPRWRPQPFCWVVRSGLTHQLIDFDDWQQNGKHDQHHDHTHRQNQNAQAAM